MSTDSTPGLPPGTYELTALFDPHVWFSIKMIALAVMILVGTKIAEQISRNPGRR